jgi:PHD/YefM family antitoxin component YafN of YafNO toxin-antitoxin module
LVDQRLAERSKGRMNAMQRQYIVDTTGKKTSVILSLERYQQLMEDLHDLAVIAERRSEEPISLEEMKRRLKEDGVL